MNDKHDPKPRIDGSPEGEHDDIKLSEVELDKFRRALPGMYRCFPEIRRLRPKDLETDDPVRRVLEDVFSEQQMEEGDARDGSPGTPRNDRSGQSSK